MRSSLPAVVLPVAIVLAISLMGRGATRAQTTAAVDLQQFFLLTAIDDDAAAAASDAIADGWRDGYAGMLWDMLRFMQPPVEAPLVPPDFGNATGPGGGQELEPREPEHPSTKVFRRLAGLLRQQTGQRIGNDILGWQQWIWEQPYEPHPEYGTFKARWYSQIDPRFAQFFPDGVQSVIRLDEVDWGGVPPNGIPPLRYPDHVPADEADYLDDDDIVFGIEVAGDARAYPKRILAWHEMAIDGVGGVDLTIVYCTLCGTVIPYENVVDGRHIRFGTSGLLYRSNKLMFDEATKSLWSTLEGRPVVGSLVDSGLELARRSMVTTTWGGWRRRHPETVVLSVETGHDRDYSEGAAYREYFGNDQLMFQVPAQDDRFDNKTEMVVMLLDDPSGGGRHPVALSTEFLAEQPIFQADVAGQPFVVVTSESGASRVYESAGRQFDAALDERRVRDDDGLIWLLTEDELVAEGDSTMRLARLPAHRAFWFGWYAQFPQTTVFD
jgi:hypothetical protein